MYFVGIYKLSTFWQFNVGIFKCFAVGFPSLCLGMSLVYADTTNAYFVSLECTTILWMYFCIVTLWDGFEATMHCNDYWLYHLRWLLKWAKVWLRSDNQLVLPTRGGYSLGIALFRPTTYQYIINIGYMKMTNSSLLK